MFCQEFFSRLLVKEFLISTETFYVHFCEGLDQCPYILEWKKKSQNIDTLPSRKLCIIAGWELLQLLGSPRGWSFIFRSRLAPSSLFSLVVWGDPVLFLYCVVLAWGASPCWTQLSFRCNGPVTPGPKCAWGGNDSTEVDLAVSWLDLVVM